MTDDLSAMLALVDLAEECGVQPVVNAVAPPAPAAKYPKPFGENKELGMVYSLNWCETHSEEWLAIYVHNLQTTTGQCKSCARDEATRRKAHELLDTRQDSVTAKVVALLEDSEEEIQQQLEAAWEAHTAEVKPLFEQDIREGYAYDCRQRAEQAVLMEITEELKAKGEK